MILVLFIDLDVGWIIVYMVKKQNKKKTPPWGATVVLRK